MNGTIRAAAAAVVVATICACSSWAAKRRLDEFAGPAYDSRLTNFASPYPVSTFSIHSQGRSLELVYMDVLPARPNGRSVLLLHGKNFSGAYWRRTIAKLSDEGFRVVAPDQIGFGKSSKPETFQFSFHALATHTKQLLDHLGVNWTAVVGHSMGGMLATRFALMFPPTVERLVLVDPIGLEDPKRLGPYVPVEEAWAREAGRTPETVRVYMQETYFHGQWKREYDELWEMQAGWTRGPDLGTTSHIAALTSDMIATQPVVHEFGALTVPTLLIVGQLDRTAVDGDDAVRYLELARAAARTIPGAKIVELPGVGHVPQYEAFDAYFAALDGFLR